MRGTCFAALLLAVAVVAQAHEPHELEHEWSLQADRTSGIFPDGGTLGWSGRSMDVTFMDGVVLLERKTTVVGDRNTLQIARYALDPDRKRILIYAWEEGPMVFEYSINKMATQYVAVLTGPGRRLELRRPAPAEPLMPTMNDRGRETN